MRAKKQGGGFGVEGDVADLVDDEQWDPSETLELLVEPARPLGLAETVDPLVGGGEGHPMAPSGGLDRQRDTQVRLAGAGWSEEDDVGGLGEEVELGEVGDGGPLDAGLGLEVEVVDGLDRREAGGLDAGLATVTVAGADLFGQDRGEVRLVVPALGAGGLGEASGDGADARGLERPG